MKTKRCNLWDDDGRPRRLRDGSKGCPRSSRDCLFVHPYEPEWAHAATSLPPPADAVADRDSDFFYISLSGRRRKPSTSSVQTDRKRDSFGSLSPRPRREDMGASSRRSRSPAGSVGSDKLERLRRDGANRHRSSREDDSSKKRRSPAPGGLKRDASMESSTRTSYRGSTNLPQASSKSSMPPPPVPSQQPPQPLQPPPPLPSPPNPPSFLLSRPQDSSTKSKKALTAAENRAVWNERIELISASVGARLEYSKVEKDIQTVNRLSQSSHAKKLPPEEAARINAQSMALERQREAKKKELSDSVQGLMGTEFWPALKQPDIPDLEAKYNDMKKHLTDLKGSIADLSAGYLALIGKSENPKPTPDADSQETSERPLKRQRISEDPEIPARTSEGSAVITCSRADLDAVRDKLQKLNDSVSELQNYICQRDADLNDEIEDQIAAKFEEVDFEALEADAKPSDAEIEAIVAPRLAEAVTGVNVTGEQLGLLAEEVANIMLQTNASALENTQNRQELNLAKELLIKTDEAARIAREAAEKDRKEMNALNATLQALISRPPAPAPQPMPTVPMAEYFLEVLEDPITTSIRAHCVPLLTQLRDELLTTTSEENTKLHDSLSPKLGNLAHYFDVFTTQVLHQDLANTTTPAQDG
ncbi:hypothetical protein BV22DRAFT_1118989 [Leucogyrophana mollusca]|uniref:Uncharacterized protein n=1 Tax=Leucogyrophana mollusca TaxID=85980 RepID=A0ACB8BKJ3_9AGAM|nr:hypothetical protein BV22DRAFT_1118989 [Leucogyrophana mollusca]